MLSARVSGAERALHGALRPPGTVFELPWGSAPIEGAGVLDGLRYSVSAGAGSWQYRTDLPHGTTLVAVPYGANLLYIARHHQRVYDFLRELVAELGRKLRFDPTQKTFRLSKVRAEEIVDYNLDLLSDSVKPPDPKGLGEMIAADASNQCFLTTPNPYFFAALAEKTPAHQLALFVCSRAPDGRTAARRLEDAGVARVVELGSGVFFNLDEFARA